MKETSTKKNKIHFFQRKRRPGKNFSLEQIFLDLRERISDRYDSAVIECPELSIGILPRLKNIIYASKNTGTVNHITGDINYVNLLLPTKQSILTILDAGILLQKKGIRKKIIELIWFRIPILKSKYVTVISEATKNHIVSISPKSAHKIKVIYVPINTEFKPVEKIFNKEKPVILQIGAAPNKNLSRLIEATKDLNCELVLIGEISDTNREKLIANKIAYQNFVGISFQEILAIYAKADILFFASTFEGFGMPILEAQTTGRVVLTSNLASMPEVGGNSVHYVDPYNVEEIKNGLIKLISEDNYREDLIKKGFENIKRFDPERIAKQYCELYDDIINSNL